MCAFIKSVQKQLIVFLRAFLISLPERVLRAF